MQAPPAAENAKESLPSDNDLLPVLAGGNAWFEPPHDGGNLCVDDDMSGGGGDAPLGEGPGGDHGVSDEGSRDDPRRTESVEPTLQNQAKIYEEQYPVSCDPISPYLHNNGKAQSPCMGKARVAHARMSSFDNSCTSAANGGSGDSLFEDPLRVGPQWPPQRDESQKSDVVEAGYDEGIDPAHGLHAFLNCYYNSSPEMVEGEEDQPMDFGAQIAAEAACEDLQQGTERSAEERNGPGVSHGRIQKKVSNPLHGALQAAMMTASSSHQTYQCGPHPYESMNQHPAMHQRSASLVAGQDDMSTPQSHLQYAELSHLDGRQPLLRRHTYHFAHSGGQQHQGVLHGSPILGVPYDHQANDFGIHKNVRMYGESEHGQFQDMHTVRRSFSANVNHGSRFGHRGDSAVRRLALNCKSSIAGIAKSFAAAGPKKDVARPSPSNSNTSGGGARGPRGSSSRYRGVTQHRRTKRWEAHVWDKGKQVYLGGFESEHRAGRAYDVVVLKTRGSEKCQTNFPLEEYATVMPYLEAVSRDDLVMLLRRRSKGFSRGSSKYIGVTKHKCGKWEARISNVNRNLQQGELGAKARKYNYLGLYTTELEAAKAHDKAAVQLFGLRANTNFEVTEYSEELVVHEPTPQEVGMARLFSAGNDRV